MTAYILATGKNDIKESALREPDLRLLIRIRKDLLPVRLLGNEALEGSLQHFRSLAGKKAYLVVYENRSEFAYSS